MSFVIGLLIGVAFGGVAGFAWGRYEGTIRDYLTKRRAGDIK